MGKYLLVAWAALLAAAPVTAKALSVEKSEVREDNRKIFGAPINSLNVGVGYGNWTGEAANQITGGVAWTARLDVDVTQPVKLEVGYFGGINSLTPSALDNFNIYTNQIQAAAQIRPVRIWEVEPYVSGGIGLTRASLAKNPTLNAVFQSDTMGVVPLAVGAQWDFTRNWAVGARAQWDILFDNEILVTENTTSSDRWSLTANVGLTHF